jgi:hypothetical protein
MRRGFELFIFAGIVVTLPDSLCPDLIGDVTTIGIGACHGDQPTGLSASNSTHCHIKNTHSAFLRVKQHHQGPGIDESNCNHVC